MLFEEVYESLVHRHRISRATAEEQGRVILRRVHDLLDETTDVNAPAETPSENAHAED
jgi:hypothetical protein